MKQIIDTGYHEPFHCSIIDMEMVSEQRHGLSSTLFLKCKLCGITKQIYSDPCDPNNIKLNDGVVLAATSIGIGYAQTEELFSSINVPFMAKQTYTASHERVADALHKSALQTMEDAGKEEAEIAKNIGALDENGIPCITVIVDGAWSKRSYGVNYNALSGVVSNDLSFSSLSANFC